MKDILIIISALQNMLREPLWLHSELRKITLRGRKLNNKEVL